MTRLGYRTHGDILRDVTSATEAPASSWSGLFSTTQGCALAFQSATDFASTLPRGVHRAPFKPHKHKWLADPLSVRHCSSAAPLLPVCDAQR